MWMEGKLEEWNMVVADAALGTLEENCFQFINLWFNFIIQNFH